MPYPEVVQRLLDAFIARDVATAVACFAEDGVLIDPHYPQSQMRGRQVIAENLRQMFAVLVQPGFSVRQGWQTAVDGSGSGAIEIDTHHRFADGSEARFPQVFVYEIEDHRLSRLQAYVPYPPPA